MHKEQAKAALEEIIKDDQLLDMLDDAQAKRRAERSTKPKPAPVVAPVAPVAPVEPPAPAPKAKAKDAD